MFITCINDDKNAVISNNCVRLQDLILFFKIPWARERISSDFTENFG